MSKNAKLSILIALAAILIIAVLLLLGGKDESGAGGDRQAGTDRSFWTKIGIGEGGDQQADKPLDPKGILLRQASEYRKRAQWPHYSHPIANKEADPVTSDFVPNKMIARHPKLPEGPVLMHYIDENSFEPDQPLVIHAVLIGKAERRLPITNGVASLTIGGLKGKVIANKDLLDQGGIGDKAGDLVHTAAFNLPAAMKKPNAPPQNLTVVLTVKIGEDELSATNVFNVGNLNIKHTGVFNDRIDSDAKGAHLAIDAEFEIKKEGFYHVQGSIYGEDGQKPIGWAQARKKLAMGKHTVTLRFYGKLLCDAKIDGPYFLQNFAYANVAQMPGPRSQNFTKVHVTGNHQASQFTCKSYEDENFLNKAIELEKQAAGE